MSGATFAALTHRGFRLLWSGIGASQIGDQMVVFALGWLVVDIAVREGTPQLGPLYLGLLGLSRAGPGLALGLFGGVFADRLDRRSVLLATQTTGGLVALGLTALALSGNVGLPAIMALVVVSATAGAFDLTTQHATLPRLVPERDLMSAIGLTNTTTNVAMFAGPLVGGILIGRIDVAGISALAAALYAFAVAALIRIPPLPAAAEDRPNIFTSLGEGIAYVVREPMLRWLMLLAVLAALFGRSAAYLLPAVAHDVLRVGAVELSWLLAARGLGTLAGSLGAASLGAVRRRGIALAVAALVFGVCTAVFAVQRALPPALVLAAAMGAAQFMFSAFASVLMQTTAPDRLRGRVLSFYLTTVTGVTPLGVLLVGALGTAVGIDAAIAAGAALLLVASFVALVGAQPLRAQRARAEAALSG